MDRSTLIHIHMHIYIYIQYIHTFIHLHLSLHRSISTLPLLNMMTRVLCFLLYLLCACFHLQNGESLNLVYDPYVLLLPLTQWVMAISNDLGNGTLAITLFPKWVDFWTLILESIVRWKPSQVDNRPVFFSICAGGRSIFRFTSMFNSFL